MNKNTRLFLMVAVSSLASQIYLNMFVDGFIVALSVVMMGIFLYIFKDLESLSACILVGVFSPLFRLIVMLWRGGSLSESSLLCLPDMAFFFSYAVFFGVVFRKLGYNQYEKYYVRLAFSEFLSNCVEITVRFILLHEFISPGNFGALILLAIVRSFFVLLVCISSDLYRSLLERTEHEENYKKLVLMASTFNSEVYFMEKNMNEIEDIMKNAFTLYRQLEERRLPKELQHLALEISKDIHEVKKGYRRVIKGIQDNFLSDFVGTSLSLKDILKILSVDVEKSVNAAGMVTAFSYSIETNYIIENHFAFMSILRNLVSNSIDALEEKNPFHGYIRIICSNKIIEDKKYCIIQVRDNGPGIAEDMLAVLFEPGFSTKFNAETGDINRGIGLTLVKDLLDEHFHGTVSISSSKLGSVFTLSIPADSLEIYNDLS
ncbi:MAG: sensor histidine kinase [Firmicutes bacterium]|nr:sensor histidine kinase [Bacillota bacterium]